MQLHDFLTHNYMIYCTQITLNQRYTISDPRLNLPYVPTSTHIQVRIWKCVSLVQCYSSVNHFRSFIQLALGTLNTSNRAGLRTWRNWFSCHVRRKNWITDPIFPAYLAIESSTQPCAIGCVESTQGKLDEGSEMVIIQGSSDRCWHAY